MRQIFTPLLALFALLAVSACGFTPLYANSGSSGQISVEEIEGREGHALRKALLEQLAPGLPGLDGPATLTVTLDSELYRLTLRPDEAAARTDVQSRARFVLDMGNDAVSGDIRAETSFNVPDAPFADITAQINASDRAMQVLARRIVDDLRISLANKK